ncbi:hypothetical protein, partial [Candidatus Symbiopectobacterium sp. NZEC135]|uniref:hypothetical protein n=1 Tax=Candidatus Symbiopectobacterium sp. NZEC135 TaxID=2820471 RepID=UPI002225CE5C
LSGKKTLHFSTPRCPWDWQTLLHYGAKCCKTAQPEAQSGSCCPRNFNVGTLFRRWYALCSMMVIRFPLRAASGRRARLFNLLLSACL